jgi:hypothetical protein
MQHCGEHDNAMQRKKDPQLGAIRQMMQPVILYLQQKAAEAQMQPPNVVAGPGAPQGPGVEPSSPIPGAPAQGAKPPDPVGDATKVMNALASLKKAGVPITDAEVNDALASAGLPPLQAGTPIPEPIQAEPVKLGRKERRQEYSTRLQCAKAFWRSK